MKFIPSRDLRIRPGKVWRDLATEGEVVITSKGQPVGILAGVTAETLEATLLAFRRARAQAAVTRIRQRARRNNLNLSMAEIDRIIRDVRRDRRR